MTTTDAYPLHGKKSARRFGERAVALRPAGTKNHQEVTL